jgi:DNA adenine methylase
MTSPLRYPGGKTRACKLLWAFLQKEYPETKKLVSPFFGGGSFELYCSANSITIFGNDAFEPLSNFWIIVREKTNELVEACELLRPVTKADFYRFRKLIETEENNVLRAAYYFAINRSSFSGSTFCGGFSEEASKGRFTESSIDRLKKIDMTNLMPVLSIDFEDFINRFNPEKDLTVFLDPPYYIQNYMYGKDGDMHKQFDHDRLANLLLTRKDWILCYNDCEYIRDLYTDCRIQKVHWSYGMNASKESNEIIILPSR